MINVNQRIGQPFGDIYTPVTSHTDRLSQQLYAEQKQREAKDEQMQAALDNEFSKNLTSIRDIDTDDLTKAYTDFKIANKAAMKQRDGISPKQQMELLKKKAAMYDIINKSKNQKALEDNTLTGLGKNRDDYEDNAHQILMQSRATPLSKLGNLYGYDYSYKGSNTDFQPLHKNSEGSLNVVSRTSNPVDKSGLQKDETEWKFGNTPKRYAEILLQGLSKHGAGRDAERIISKVPLEVINQTQDEYLKIPIEKWNKIGLDKPQDLTIKPTDSKAEIYAKHNAQLYFLNNEPVQGRTTRLTNKSAEIDKNFANKKQLENTSFLHSMRKIAANKQGQPTNDVSGNSFDEFGSVEDLPLQSGGVVSKGTVYNKDGSLYTGEMVINRKDFPVNVTTSLSAGKIKTPDMMNVKVKNGVIQSVMTPNGEVSRQAIENLQKKANTEPVKAAQPVYGSGRKEKQVEAKSNKKETVAERMRRLANQ